MVEKDALRRALKAKTLQYVGTDFTEEDRLTCSALAESELYRGCDTLFAFHPLSDEVDITPLLGDAIRERQLALPKTEDDGSLTFFIVTDLSALRRGRWAITEPGEGAIITPAPGDLMIIPALAYDRCGQRLGRGKGYYDRYLQEYNSAKTVGVCRSYQLLERIPTQAWDRAVDHVLCGGMFY